jgi:cellulose biosynthesis protein BcsQ
MWDWLAKWLDLVPPEYRGHTFSGLLAAVGIFGAVIGGMIRGWFGRRKLQGTQDEVERGQQALSELLRRLGQDETTLWTAFPAQPPFKNFPARVGRATPPILTVANLTGGVGKTTLVVNLAAHLSGLGKRVLLVDLDYQGSLTTMLRLVTGRPEKISKVNELLKRDPNYSKLLDVMEELPLQLPKSYLVPAFYELARFEDLLMTGWLIREGGDDIRYRLARVLLDDKMRQRFDVVLIDAPSRLTTGMVNALCASTHLLIPAIFNPPAAETVENFLGVTKDVFINNLNARLKVIGVLETLSPASIEGQQPREQARRTIEEALQKWFPDVRILNNNVPRRIAPPEEGIAIVPELEPVLNEIRERIGL